MLSSQPLCFNLFGPVKLDDSLSNRFWSKRFPASMAQVEQVRVPRFFDSPCSEWCDWEHARVRAMDRKARIACQRDELAAPFGSTSDAKGGMSRAIVRRNCCRFAYLSSISSHSMPLGASRPRQGRSGS
jgi:hypothetical protein